MVSGSFGTDLMVLCSCQWTKDLQEQGVPAVALHKNHHNAIASQAGADLIARLVREKQPRWDRTKVAAERKIILGAEPQNNPMQRTVVSTCRRQQPAR